MNAYHTTPGTSLQHAGPYPLTKQTDTAQGLIEGADFLTGKRYYRSAAFMLHQAAWQLLTALVQASNCRYPGMPNLEALFCFVAGFAPQLNCIFPRNSPAEQQLFGLLQNACADVWYTDAYGITRKQLEELVYRLAQLAEVVEEY